MRAASKTLKRHSFIRRHFRLKIDGFIRPEQGKLDVARRDSLAGFTIVETLIVLAVTGMLFVIAAVQLTGKQNETEFQQGINDVNSNLQKIINQMSTGDFQAAQQIQCDNTGTGGVPNIGGYPKVTQYTGMNPDNEGTSDFCNFEGKIVNFFNSVGNKDRQYIIYPVAGIRTDAAGNDCTTIACAKPIVIAPDSGQSGTPNNASIFPDLGEIATINYGITIYNICFVQGSSAPQNAALCPAASTVGGFGIFDNLNTPAGSQQFYLVPMRGTQITHNSYDTSDGGSRQNTVSWLNRNAQWSYNTVQNLVNSNSDYSVQICLVSGTTKQSGLIVIGGNGGNINSVTTTIYGDRTCT